MSRRSIAVVAATVMVALLALVPGAAHAGTATSTGPDAAWDFNERSGGSTVDTSGNGVTGTLGSGATWTTTAHAGGGAVSLDGTANGYVSSSAAVLNTSTDYTVS